MLAKLLAAFPRLLTLSHLGGSLAGIDPRTLGLRYNDPRLSSWLGVTQTWSWPAGPGWASGDAVVVITGNIGEAKAMAVIRVGDCLEVADITGRGIKGWFEQWGIGTVVAS